MQNRSIIEYIIKDVHCEGMIDIEEDKSKKKTTRGKSKTKETTKKTTKKLDIDLSVIASLMLEEPLLSQDVKAFEKHVAQKLTISLQDAKTLINEFQNIQKMIAEIDYKRALSQKLQEYAHIKSIALKQNNLNAYLGAVKAESELLGLKHLSIFAKNEDESEQLKDLEEKKQMFLKKIIEKENK